MSANMNTKSAAKYRPYFTIQQIHYILDLVQNDGRTQTERIQKDVLQYLKLFIVKNELGAVRPAFITSPRESMSDKLGLGLDDLSEHRLAAYELWLSNPKLCTPYEIQQAKLYRYENDLMSSEEEYEYENLSV